MYLFIYFICLHVSSVTALIIRRSNCINTSSGMISLCKWLLGMPVRTGIPSSHLYRLIIPDDVLIQFDLLMMKAMTLETCLFVRFPGVKPIVVVFSQPGSGLQPPRFRGFLITNKDVPHSVGLPWTSDQSVAENSTWQHTTLTTDKHPCPLWDSNPQSQQASGRRPTP